MSAVACLFTSVSCLFLKILGKKEEHLNMLEGGIIAKLLEEKWTTFAQMIFLKRLIICIIHLISISIAIYTRPGKSTSLLNGIRDGEINSGDVTRYCFEVATILGCLAYLIIQQGEGKELILQDLEVIIHPKFPFLQKSRIQALPVSTGTSRGLHQK